MNNALATERETRRTYIREWKEDESGEKPWTGGVEYISVSGRTYSKDKGERERGLWLCWKEEREWRAELVMEKGRQGCSRAPATIDSLEAADCRASKQCLRPCAISRSFVQLNTLCFFPSGHKQITCEVDTMQALQGGRFEVIRMALSH